MSAASHVFGIPELLDMILEHAPARDLLLQQRTNKSWQATIQRSIPMQENLFLKPIINPPNGNARKTFLGSHMEWNPFLAKMSRPPCNNTHYCELNSKQFNLDSQYTASWQHMLVTNPPCSRVNLYVDQCLYWFDRISPPKGEAGVRMEQVVKGLKVAIDVGVLGRQEHGVSCQIVVPQRYVEDFKLSSKR